MGNPRDPNEPSQYQISVEGRLDPKWSDWFDGFEITYTNGNTILTGMVPDQAALHGLLAKIRDLGLPILLVRQMEFEA